MTLDVKIIDQQLEDSLTAMKSIESTLGGLKETDLGLADACGNKELAKAIESFSSSWRIKRADLVDMTKAHRLAIQAVLDWSDHIDRLVAPDGKKEERGGKSGGDGGGNLGMNPEEPQRIMPAPFRQGPLPEAHGEIGGGSVAPGLSATGTAEGPRQSQVSGQGSRHTLDSATVTGPTPHTATVGDAGADDTLEATTPVEGTAHREVDEHGTDTTLDATGTKDQEASRIREVLGELVDVTLDELSPDQLARVGSVSAVAALAAIALATRTGSRADGDGTASGARHLDPASALRQALVGGGQEPAGADAPRGEGDVRKQLADLLDPADSGQNDNTDHTAVAAGPDALRARLEEVDPPTESTAGSGAFDSLPLAGEAVGGRASGGDGTLPGTSGTGVGSTGLPLTGPASWAAPEEAGIPLPDGDLTGGVAEPAPLTPAGDGSRSNGAMLGGMGMAAGLAAQAAGGSGDSARREDEARKVRDRLQADTETRTTEGRGRKRA